MTDPNFDTGAEADADLEVLRLSAEACGHEVVYSESCEPCTMDGDLAIRRKGTENIWRWNPLVESEHRDECRNVLLKTHIIELEELPGQNAHCVWRKNGRSKGGFCLNCPTDEFFARALAKIQRRKR